MPPAPSDAATWAAAMSKSSTGATSKSDARLSADHPASTDAFVHAGAVVEVVDGAVDGAGVETVAGGAEERGGLEQPTATATRTAMTKGTGAGLIRIDAIAGRQGVARSPYLESDGAAVATR